MKKYLVNSILNAGALFLAIWILQPHIMMQNNSWYAYLILGAIFGLVNTLIKPIVMIASCPLILLTLGLATLVVNTALFYLAGWIGRMFDFGFIIPQQTFYYAFLGALIVSTVSYILNRIFDTSR